MIRKKVVRQFLTRSIQEGIAVRGNPGVNVMGNMAKSPAVTSNISCFDDILQIEEVRNAQ